MFHIIASCILEWKVVFANCWPAAAHIYHSTYLHLHRSIVHKHTAHSTHLHRRTVRSRLDIIRGWRIYIYIYILLAWSNNRIALISTQAQTISGRKFNLMKMKIYIIWFGRSEVRYESSAADGCECYGWLLPCVSSAYQILWSCPFRRKYMCVCVCVRL